MWSRYAPELNPDEFVWTQAKQELSNTDHEELVPLTLHVVRSLQRIGHGRDVPIDYCSLNIPRESGHYRFPRTIVFA